MTRVMLISLGLLLGCSDYDFHRQTDTPDAPNDPDKDGNDGTDTTGPNADSGGVTGRICAPSQNVYVANADVWVELSDGTRISTTTDANGYFTLEGLPVGTHTVNVAKGSFTASFDVLITKDEITVMAEEECLEGDIEIAVVTGEYDNVEHILDRLGLDYDLFDGTYFGSGQYIDLLGNPSRMSDYDIIFFNCGMDDSWVYGYGGITLNEIQKNIRDFVQNGGSIYASDWAYYMVEAPFPSMMTFVGPDNTYGSAQVGESGYFSVEVLDAGLQAVLGSNTATINYDLPSWVVPESGNGSEILVRGSVAYYEDWSLVNKNVPLVITGQDNGRVMYTSFHNETQTTVDMDRMLEQMALDL